MAEHRPFPASPRRRALARSAGLHAASPILVGAAALAIALVVLALTGRSRARALGDAIAAACAGHATLAPGALVGAVLDAALPLLGAIAIVAAVAHIAQTRAIWLPRRRIPGAPAVDTSAMLRTRRTAAELLAAAAIGATTFLWLWRRAAALAALSTSGLAIALILELAAALTTAVAALAILDALARHLAVAQALAMTSSQKREDDRLAGADPRWRARRAEIARSGPADAVATAAVVLLGDDLALAIAWDPARRPVPTRTARGRGPVARQLVGLARRAAVPVHRDAALARALDDGGEVPAAHWPRLAEIIAAARSRGTRADDPRAPRSPVA